MSADAARVAVAGLGRMGLPICVRLLDAGYHVLATDLVAARRAEAARHGAEPVETIAEAAGAADLLITSLPGPEEVEDVIGPLTGSLRPQACWIDLSTGGPGLARMVATAAGRRDLCVLDAPVGGSPERARQGTLTLYVGGDARDLDRQRPVLQALARQILHVGPHGSGYAVKLLVNALWFAQAVSTAEAFALGSRLQLDPDVLHAALGQSAAGGRFLDEDAGALLSGDARTAFPLRRCGDELTAVVALGAELGVPLDVAPAVARVHADALAHYGDVDGELLGARFVLERTGLELPGQS